MEPHQTKQLPGPNLLGSSQIQDSLAEVLAKRQATPLANKVLQPKLNLGSKVTWQCFSRSVLLLPFTAKFFALGWSALLQALRGFGSNFGAK